MLVRCHNSGCKDGPRIGTVPITYFKVIHRKEKPEIIYCSKSCKNSSMQTGRAESPEHREAQSKAWKLRTENPKLFTTASFRKNKKWKGVINSNGSQFLGTDFIKALAAQDGKCGYPGCEVKQSELYQALSVDHDHTTGRFRALLCSHHNSMVVRNHTLDSIRILLAYLTTHEATVSTRSPFSITSNAPDTSSMSR